MAAMQTDAFLFIQGIQTKFWLGMLAAVDSMLISVARGPASHQRAEPFHPGADAEFMRFLMSTREYLLGDGRLRPAGLDDLHFLLLKPLCERLVAQGRFAPERLALFAIPAPWAQAAEALQPERKPRI
jgi:hypothetical protein